MKMRSHTRIIGLDGVGREVSSNLPTSREEALEEDVAQYQEYPFKYCPVCNVSHTTFTTTGRRSCCSIESANSAYRCNLRIGGPTNPTEARDRDADYYFRAAMGSKCGHIGKRTLDDKCYQCEHDRINSGVSPRQAALAAGETWYMPVDGDLCPAGHLARRRVVNGSCEECETLRRAVAAAPPLIQDVWPAELPLSKADAAAAGFKVYRSTSACKRGHIGWRYVSTGGCLDCK
jgi:hypothetical protein